MKHAILLAITVLTAGTTRAQIVITQTQTSEELVQDVLLGTGVVISNVTFNGQPGNTITEQMSFFDGELCNVGIDYGVLLATGSTYNAEGPNDIGSSTTGGGNFGQTDPDLVAIGNSATINDAAVLEFDFVAISDTVLFEFVFGSDEYLEYVNTAFNDVYGFFLSGPGISGPYSNNAINIALIPGTSIPITIDNVNSTANSAYYVNNGTGFDAPYNTDPYYIQYDGFTVPITIIAQVVEGETHHMKIAIGDAGDTAFDSAVFLSGASFMSPEEISTGLEPGALNGPMAIITAPNPATDLVRITSRAQDRASIRVTDAAGRELIRVTRRAAGIQTDVIDTSSWPPGFYQVQLTGDDGRTSATTLVVAR